MSNFHVGQLIEYTKTYSTVYVKLDTGFDGYIRQDDALLKLLLNKKITRSSVRMNNGVALISNETAYFDWYQARIFVKPQFFRISTDEKIYINDSSGKSVQINFNGIVLGIEPVPSVYRMSDEDQMYTEALSVLEDAIQNNSEIDVVYTEGKSYGYYKILYIQKSYLR
jgi:hypothetical protein